MMSEMIESMELQLAILYNEKEVLEKEINVSSPEDILQMIESLSMQLSDLYKERENSIIVDGNTITVNGPRKISILPKK